MVQVSDLLLLDVKYLLIWSKYYVKKSIDDAERLYAETFPITAENVAAADKAFLKELEDAIDRINEAFTEEANRE